MSMAMVIIRPRTTGAMWLRALFRFYCRKYECFTEYTPIGECFAIGTLAKKAEHEFEFAKARLLNATVDAIACNPDIHPSTVAKQTTRDFVKEVYRSGAH